jgi:molybdopterin synthase sulfur carrier subunit
MAMIKILYFARLRESLEKTAEELELPYDNITIEGLRQMLAARGGAWQQEFAGRHAIRAAINQNLALENSAIHDGDEVAFFPPVTGG